MPQQHYKPLSPLLKPIHSHFMHKKLDEIARYKRQEIIALYQDTIFAKNWQNAQAQGLPPVRGFTKALQKRRTNALIAELKKSSPSKGLIRANFNPQALAKDYEAGGATCLSVLTDIPSFQGHPSYIALVKSVSSLPVIRKDFILDTLQIDHSRLLGADAILLIMAMLDTPAAQRLCAHAQKLDLDVLVEIHNEKELENALTLPTPLLGINNRNLQSFHTDLETFTRLAPHCPRDKFLVAESGLHTPQDLAHMRAQGAHGFLIGESLMRQDDVQSATRALLQPLPDHT